MSPKRGDCLSVEVERLSGGVFATTHVYECLKNAQFSQYFQICLWKLFGNRVLRVLGLILDSEKPKTLTA